MTRTIPLAAGIVALDTRMAGLDELVAAYLVPGANPAVVETGPATVATNVVAGLESLGISREDVAFLVVSHIHLDHAGGAGDLIRAFPNATLIVHRAGAPHMADPSRLMASAQRVFGPALDTLFGSLAPVPAERLRAVDPGDRVDLGGGRSLEVVDATGHAKHHMALLDSESGALFVGDALGVFMPEAGVLRPATPPPEFDLEAALATLERFRERQPAALYLSHFGPAPAGRDLIAEAEERLVRFAEIVRGAMRETTDLDVLARRLEEGTAPDYAGVRERPDLLAKFETLNAFRSSAAGYLRYFQQHGLAP
ncbi:MAG: MBL fold metallo-hydrolase [Acidobacteria bacterium]|nr:MBL fold metallo-hydrolase [Acidobacteriota bacterium]